MQCGAREQFLKILCILACIIFNVVWTRELEDYKLYVLQNAQDKTYLKALNNGEICDNRGEVITSRYLDEHSNAYRWRHRALLNGNVHLDTDSHDFKINELTMQDTPPNCYSALAEYELAYVYENMYRIKNFHTKKCLSGKGMGQRISWEPCQSLWRNKQDQFWNFIDIEKQKLFDDAN
ncbi:hypothetical protein Ocin01_11349 [Orchesella cincta]|uniref:Ricin B lectin domain-containing protein n=1 Tax=Orchesella cincta TaxID=48709 RepID=A0A1D2MQE3_ORCCI|nr:hypothetical protein Ocin01_11349 [Orchesella cincta]